MGLRYLLILGSVLAICVCCCRGSSNPGEWNWQRYFACIRRCRLPTAILIVSLFIIGVLAVFIATGAAPAGVVLVNILLAAIFAPLLVWFICCAYENP